MTPTESTKKITCQDGDCKVTELFQPIHKYSRTGFDGKLIKCPECESTVRVYGLAWRSYPCEKCNKRISKYRWMIENELE